MRNQPIKSGWGAVGSSTLPIPGDVESCMNELGIQILKITNNEVIARCPAHLERLGKEDGHPSWSVLVDDKLTADGDVIPAGTHSCFSCSFSGTFVSLVQYVLDYEIGDAEAWVRARGGKERAKKVLARRNASPAQTDTTKVINEASLALMDIPPREVLAKRNLSHESAIHYGVLWDASKSAWILPIRDPDTNKLRGWQVKNERIFKNQPYSVKKADTLFGLDVFDSDTIICMESPLDTLRLFSAGVVGGVATYGASVSTSQIDLMCIYADTIIIAMDNDSPGWAATKKIYSRAKGKVRIRVFNYNGMAKVKDPGDMTDAQILFGLREAIPAARMTRLRS